MRFRNHRRPDSVGFFVAMGICVSFALVAMFAIPMFIGLMDRWLNYWGLK
jgi:hypothetical protein